MNRLSRAKIWKGTIHIRRPQNFGISGLLPPPCLHFTQPINTVTQNLEIPRLSADAIFECPQMHRESTLFGTAWSTAVCLERRASTRGYTLVEAHIFSKSKGPSLKDVRKIFGIFDAPSCPYFDHTYSTKFTQHPLLCLQPPLLCLLSGQPHFPSERTSFMNGPLRQWRRAIARSVDRAVCSGRGRRFKRGWSETRKGTEGWTGGRIVRRGKRTSWTWCKTVLPTCQSHLREFL